MTTEIEKIRRQLGELAALEAKTEQAERKILERAESLLADLEGKLPDLRRRALTGDEEAERAYQDAILERGRLQQVIAQSRAVLGMQ